eukprot:TRINITY_DN23609_c0_g1_i1.p1 TRINITY_DN23609_c0_g1~~TRINITY_DN23609_c0_g1_i1.p1  ORF type:complete len:185 (+),score=39.80 TRINITY_DN23609_c0_g1_i1:236-790(+)
MADAAVPSRYSHPQVIFFTIFFKAAAIVSYVVLSWFTLFVVNFVVTVLLLSFDFWTVKNVSGRILVGLRYWSETSESGESVWKFESVDEQTMQSLNKNDAWAFWISLYATPVVWVISGISILLRFDFKNFDYLLIVAIALILSAANIVGFTKCRKDAKKQMQQFAQRTVAAHLTNTITNAMNLV